MSDIRADGIAVYVFRRVAGELEFLQIKRTESTGEYQNTWQIVYGGIEKSETAVHAALRELTEETGLTPKFMMQAEYLETFYFRPHDYVLIMPVFAAEVEPNAPIILNKEHSDFRWVRAELIDAHFMWRTQREALAIILEELHHPTAARPMLTINLTKESKQ